MNPHEMPTLSLAPHGDPVAIPQIGFGVWQVSETEIEPAVGHALAAGYRHIDTARLYFNEEGVGQAVRNSGLPREDVFVTTKLWNDDQLQVESAFNGSLQRLGMDYVDLYLIHWPVPAADAYAEAWQQLIELRESGRARAVGVSNFHPEHLERVKDLTGEYPAVNQIEMHPYLQQAEVRAFCAEKDIVVEAWSPLASGKRVLADDTIGRIAAAHQVTPAQVIIRWHLQLGVVALPKSVTPSRIAENIDVFGFELTDQDMTDIAALDQDFRTGPNPDEFNYQPAR